MGTQADLPPNGSARYITEPTQLAVSSELKITTQYAEIWADGRLCRQLVNEVVVGVDLPWEQIILNPMGVTRIEGEGAADPSIQKQCCYALFEPGTYRRMEIPVVAWTPDSTAYEMLPGRRIHCVGYDWSGLASGVQQFTVTAPIWNAMYGPAYTSGRLPVWLRMRARGWNAFRFLTAGSASVINTVGMPMIDVEPVVSPNPVLDYGWEMWIQVWHYWHVLEMGAQWSFSTTPANFARDLQADVIPAANVRFEADERLRNVAVRPARMSGRELRQLNASGGAEPRAGGPKTFEYGISGRITEGV